ncbi:MULTISPECIES: class A sortase [unclassified Enterococcus]|uniref:class A sortase n=1 Tax=unclassified Enterococcus TaxID=2608891 RepID=UPI001A90DDEB|nr:MULTISPECIES: class A sortase [unclassified Enterococcus]MBO0462416.1 class A sortase [Enterococcus sp. DIV1298c]MBO1300640.1 class A sortase [Enterococcus sp. DIV1271a]
MRKKKIKFVIHLLFVIGVSLLSFPVIKNTLTLIRIQTTKVVVSSELPPQKPNEIIHLPTLENYLYTSSESIGEAIGEIVIPSQNINTPIFAGLNNDQMLFGVGSMYPERNPETENMLLFGHHLGMAEILLGNVTNLEVGDKIYVKYLSKGLNYEVVENKLVMETDFSVLENTDHAQLTIITCNQPTITDKRIVIVAKLLDEVEEHIEHIQQRNENNDRKIMRRSIVKYSVVPILIILFILMIGNYTIWRYV